MPGEADPLHQAVILMWVDGSIWFLADREMKRLAVGDTISQVALRANCWSTQISDRALGLQDAPRLVPDRDDGPRYELTGIVTKQDDSNAMILDTGDLQFLAEPYGVRWVNPPGYAERFASPDYHLHDVGARVTVACNMEILASHEEDSFDLEVPPFRDWPVRAIQLQSRDPDIVAGGRKAGSFSRGPTVGVEDVTVAEGLPAFTSLLLDLVT
jgi:hypothetical protein